MTDIRSVLAACVLLPLSLAISAPSHAAEMTHGISCKMFFLGDEIGFLEATLGYFDELGSKVRYTDENRSGSQLYDITEMPIEDGESYHFIVHMPNTTEEDIIVKIYEPAPGHEIWPALTWYEGFPPPNKGGGHCTFTKVPL